jgi:hypothetical protein
VVIEMSDVSIDLTADWSHFQEQELTRMGYALKSGATPEEISLTYYKLERRLIPTNRRTVQQSREMSCPIEQRSGLTRLLKKATTGADLRPHQSTKLLQADYDDALLNDWRIHHFHLGTDPHDKLSGFVKRTGPVLYAYVTSNEFFAIDVLDHSSFARQRLLEIIHRNWPNLIAHYSIRGSGLEFVPTDADIKTLRSGHVQGMTLIDGVIYAPPGGGYATDGTSMEVVLQHQNAQRTLRRLNDYILKNIQGLVEQARSEGSSMTPPYDFKLHGIDSERIYVIEANSAVVFPFPMRAQKPRGNG